MTTDTNPTPPRRQLTDLAELAGKTVARAVEFENRGEVKRGIVFDDNSFLFISMFVIDEDVKWVTSMLRPGTEDLVAMGLATSEEVSVLEQQQQEIARTKELFERERDRREYERLRAKYEGEGHRPNP